MSPGELITLLGVGFENSVYNARLGLREARLLGSQPWWWRLKTLLNVNYFLDPPVLVCKRELKKAGLPAQDATFGETPLITTYRLLEELGVGPADTLVDLGCGRGQTLLLGALAFGCQGIGVEALPTFVARARLMAHQLGLESLVSFERRDFRESPLPEGTLYFVSATCLESDSWEKVKHLMIEAPYGSRALVVSAALPRLCWETEWERLEEYSWGTGTTYLQRRLGPRTIKSRKRKR